MPNRTYALLVGINDYPPGVSKLSGCLNDVDRFRGYLEEHVSDRSSLAVEVLKDGDATRANIIEMFRKHLGRAEAGDKAVFLYCGHGARSASNVAFREFFPDGKDEGLVCFDSRRAGGHDLADKELAVLIAEVVRGQAELAVLLDCCHSGSATRDVDAFRGLTPRLADDRADDRALETYLDGHYARLQESGRRLVVPTGRHILLAACERGQLAKEKPGDGGVFTSTLLEVLRKSGGALSYSDLFVRCRAAVLSRAFDQDPQFEAHRGFDAGGGFLGRDVGRDAPRYSATFENGGWSVNCGAVHGVRTQAESTASFALSRDDSVSTPVGMARALRVGAQATDLALDFDGDESQRYRARITSLPVPPLAVAFVGDSGVRAAVQHALDGDRSVPVVLVDDRRAARYAVTTDANQVLLSQTERGLNVGHVDSPLADPPRAAEALLAALKNITRWEFALALRNPQTKLDTSLVDIEFVETAPDGREYRHTGEDLTFNYRRFGTEWQEIPWHYRVRNRAAQTLYAALMHFSEAFGIQCLRNEPLESGADAMTLWTDAFCLDEDQNEAIDHLLLVVSTEKLDDFLLTQNELELGADLSRTLAARAISSSRGTKKLVHENEWFTHRLRVRTVRQVDQVGTVDATLAGGQIVVKGHPSIKANVSIGGAQSGTRDIGATSDFYRALEERGLSLVNFTGTRGGDQSVLEITDIIHGDTLVQHPLQIELKRPLAADEAILPLVFDGKHILLGGSTEIGADGVTRVSIDHLPDIPDPRRGLGGSLKLYFFKTYLGRENVNRLRWVEYKPDGSLEHHDSHVAEQVRAARRVLLLVHGIIGDTEGMASGARDCGLDRQFDLVLTYDYENLNTPIAETARVLKARLLAAGLHEGDDKRLTLLVHSMGGLVSRWFIEREGGNRVVDHLVMCGTPNHGSPFGRIDQARGVMEMLTAVSLNYAPMFIPFACATLLLLGRSRKLTPALEQMNPASDFIRMLNESPDPAIPYTILAGDVASYQETGDALFARLLAKTGRRALDVLFANQPNDIAVGVDSILAVQAERASAPTRMNVACHHLNYFVSEAGQRALKSVAWQDVESNGTTAEPPLPDAAPRVSPASPRPS